MARAYSVRLVALTIGMPPKWVDNLLSHHALPGVARAKQGVERRITDDGLLAIELVRLLATELGSRLEYAAAIAREVVESRSASQLRFVTRSGVAIVFPLVEIEQRLRDQIVEAVDSVARIRRGRPSRDAAAE